MFIVPTKKYVLKRNLSNNTNNHLKNKRKESDASPTPLLLSSNIQSSSLKDSIMGKSPNQFIKQKISDMKDVKWNISDFLAVSSAIFLLGAIIGGPTMIREMKKSDINHEDIIDPEDLTLIYNQALDYARDLHSLSGVDQKEDQKNLLVNGAADIISQVLQTEKVQHSLINLVLSLFQSPQIIESCHILVKNLFEKLVNDPQTTEQLIDLFRNLLV